MACLDLENGDFLRVPWINRSDTIKGVTANWSEQGIAFEKDGETLDVFGNFQYAVFGDLGFIALLELDFSRPGQANWTVSIVDTSRQSLSVTALFSGSSPPTDAPELAMSPVNGRLAFLSAMTRPPEPVEARNLLFVRSDDGSVVWDPGVIRDISPPTAAITAANLVVRIPGRKGSIDNLGPRPLGRLRVEPPNPRDFGTVVLGGDSALDPRTETFTLRNDGSDCLTVSAIGSVSPYRVDDTSPNMPVELEPGDAMDVYVRFEPSREDDFTQTLRVTRDPPEGDSDLLCVGAACVVNSAPVLPAEGDIDFGAVEQGLRAARFRVVRNEGNVDVKIRAQILRGADADRFDLIMPGDDISEARRRRDYTILPTTRCGEGATGSGEEQVAVVFHADAGDRKDPYIARLEIKVMPDGVPALYDLSASITAAAPIDVALVIDRSGSMSDTIGSGTKMEAALRGAGLFVQLLRPEAGDRAAIVSFSDAPTANVAIAPVADDRTEFEAALSFTPSGRTNIAGGIILARAELDPARSPARPGLKRAIVALTDGMENRCFQDGGEGPWLSITGRDPPGMARPDGTPQASEVLSARRAPPVHAIALGNPADVDGAALDALSSATGAAFDQVVDLTGADFFLLEKHFTQIFMNLAGQAIITDPFRTIAAGQTQVHEFDIFPGDMSATVIVYDPPEGRLPFTLVSPRGEEISRTSMPRGFGVRFRSTATARIVEVTFPKGESDRYATTAAQRWQVVVAHRGRLWSGDIKPWETQRRSVILLPVGLGGPGVSHAPVPPPATAPDPGFTPPQSRRSRAAIGYGIAIAARSNLRMQARVEPGIKPAGSRIRLGVKLGEAGLPVRGATVTVQATDPTGSTSELILRERILRGRGTGTEADYDGLFARTRWPGVYRFLFRAIGTRAGRPFVREEQRTKTVYESRRPTWDGPADDDERPRKPLQPLKLRLPIRPA